MAAREAERQVATDGDLRQETTAVDGDRWWSTVDDGDQNWITTAQAAAMRRSNCERQWATPIVDNGPQRWTASDNSGQRLTAADGG
jgi:hypothetical protein